MNGGNQRQTLRAAAFAYAEGGWPVFPLRPGTKRPATPNHTADSCDGSDPKCAWAGHVGWEQRATTDARRITRGWDRHPYAIGIACGPAGLVVIDLDTPKPTQPITGAESLAELEDRHRETLPATWTVGTPSGGRHLYYRQPPVRPFGNTAGRVGPGIDTRGNGGYVAAPPTATATGDYWLVDDHPPASLPDWFARLLTTPTRQQPTALQDPRQLQRIAGTDRADRYVARAMEGERHRIASAVEGCRNHTLFTASIALGQLVGAHALDHHQAEQVLLDAADDHITAGAYSHHQARQTIASGMRRGITEPRQLPTDTPLTGANR